MLRKFRFFLFIGLLSSLLNLANTFADDNGEAIDLENIIAAGNFEFPTADGGAYVQGNAEFEKIPEVILGDPDFEKMRDLPTESRDYQLGRKVGMILVLNRARDRVKVCTGFLIGPDLFMTNHHCIHDEQGLLPLGRSSAIYMDYYQDTDVDPTRGGITARASTVLRADEAKDYALLRLDRPIGDTYGWLDLDTTTEPDASQSVKLMSHNDGRSKEIVRRNSQIYTIPPGHPLFDVPSAIAYFADSEPGSSGSPVFLRDGTGVIGIHHSGWSTTGGVPIHNSGTLMAYIVPEIQQYLPQPPAYMYWVDAGTDKIQRANLDNGSNIAAIVTTGLRTPTGIAVDVDGGKMYWVDAGTDKIQRANLNGSNIQDLITTGLRTPAGIAIDVGGGKMYWIDAGTDKIQRANLDGSNIEDIVTTGLTTPKGIAVDLKWGHLYWIDAGTDKIQRANLDGSNIEDIVTTELQTPTGIAVDMEADKVYWIDSGTDKIQRANLDGSNIEDIVTTDLRTPNGIAVDIGDPENPSDGKVYWIDAGTDKIQRANLNGSNIEDIITTDLRTPNGIALGIPQIVPTRPPGPGPGPIDPADVNRNGQVTVADLAIVALFYGTKVPAGVDLPADVNADGVVNISDLMVVAGAIDAAGNAGGLPADDIQVALEAIANIEGAAEAPGRISTSQRALLSGVAYQNVAAAFKDVKHLAPDNARLGKWMPVFTELLPLLREMRHTPDTTALLPNYPNPFNPETWIPYHLSKGAEVILTIHDVRGVLVRELTLGYQAAGIYESRARAAYWDGKNRVGEPVASGVYFYTLTAGEFTATRKLLIVK